MTPEQLAAFALAVQRQIGAAAVVLGNHAFLFERSFPQCSSCECKPATVKHKNLETVCCDRCAAEQIVQFREPEGIWRDLPTADALRKIREYLEISKMFELPIEPS